MFLVKEENGFDSDIKEFGRICMALEDGRKIHIGDCALFKPPLDSPPFIGIIRRVRADKENRCCLDVNWLYRPAEIKLAKGILTDAAPNEVFYSFHKDEIPAASLLHPCKVAFLHKGVELPSGISSFMCRRVYDTVHKCLWWLTDKNYINEWQEEVDQLLDKTSQEMHVAVQPGGRSPKTLNGPTSVLQSQPCSDSVQNNSSLTLQAKHRKRERVDQVSEPNQRECLFKAEDGESGQENTSKYEISKLTDKRELVDIEGVEKLIKLMQMDSVDKKIDLADRIILVDVLAATDRPDCIGWFLQLRGLPVLDEWLQDYHKGKICEGSGLKESDKSIDEFLFSVLRALEKLPVNLPALQTCNIGKSVNHLRTHKNYEIQRKARSLVEKWKKRVEAEMNDNDAKSCLSHGAAWPTKPVLSEVPNIGSRKSGMAAEGGAKNLTVRPATPRNSLVKFNTTEIIAHPSSSGAIMSTTSLIMTSKDQNLKESAGAGAPDFPITTNKDEKSSSSSQSQSNSHSGEYAKTEASSHKEDEKSSTAGLDSKFFTGASHGKSNNGHHVATVSPVQKESISGKVTASSKNLIFEKFSTASHDKLSDSPILDHGNSRLIVRLSNTSRSPTRSAPGDFSEQPVISCRRNSVSAERPRDCDNKVTGKENVIQGNTATDGNSDIYHQKELHGSEDVTKLSTHDKQHAVGEDDGVPVNVSKFASLSTKTVSRSGKSYESSLSSMDALIESCAKFSECSASPGDEVGMNLLASVAAEEISKSSNTSLLDSPGKKSPLTENLTSDNSSRLNQSPEEFDQTKSDARATDCMVSELVTGGEIENKAGHCPPHTSTNSFEDRRCPLVGCSRRLEDCGGHLKMKEELPIPPLNLEKDGKEENMEITKYTDQTKLEVSVSDKVECSLLSTSKLKQSLHLHEHEKIDHANTIFAENSLKVDSKGTATFHEKEVDEKGLCPSSDMGINHQMNQELTNTILRDKVSPLVSEISPGISEDKSEGAVKVNGSGNVSEEESRFNMLDNVKLGNNADDIGRQMVNVGSNILEADCANEITKKTNIPNSSSLVASHETPSLLENDKHIQCLSAFKTDDSPSKKVKEVFVLSECSPVSGPDPDVKLNFDLNECFSVDDTNQDELVNHADDNSSFAVKLSSPSPFSISSKSGALPALITVASAAKGPVIPPENLLQTNGEHGWKGSAATSAFRPAEPRKNLLMPLSMSKEGCRPLLDFDLNEPDETLLEEIAFQSAECETFDEYGPLNSIGGRDLDLNSVEESSDLGSLSMGSCRQEISTLESRHFLHATHDGVNVSRDFDLNNGPCSVQEAGTELTSRYQRNKNSVPFSSTVPSLRMNSVELGNFPSWFSPGNYSAITAVPTIFSGRGDQSYVDAAGSLRLLVPPTSATPYTSEMYRGPVLSPSSSMPFPPSTPFHYPAFSLDTRNSFSGCSTVHIDSISGGSLCYPNIPSQVVGPTGLVSSPYPRPYIMSFPGGSSNVHPDNGKWGNLGLDLNTGPGDTERRDERIASSLRHFPGPNSQSLVDEPPKMFQVGGVLKRKDPDNGLDVANRFSNKRPSLR